MPVAAAVAMAPKPRSRRGLWMMAGALATAAAVIAAIEFGPWKGTNAAPQPPPVQQQAQSQPVNPAPAQAPAVTTPQPLADQPAAAQPPPAQRAQPPAFSSKRHDGGGASAACRVATHASPDADGGAAACRTSTGAASGPTRADSHTTPCSTPGSEPRGDASRPRADDAVASPG